MGRPLTQAGRINKFKSIMTTESGDPILTPSAIENLINKGFFNMPASTKHHGNYEGGLFDHCFSVTNSLLEMTKRLDLKWSRPESPKIVGMFHDLCKIDSYVVISHPKDPNVQFGWNPDQSFSGHGDKSILLLAQIMQLTEEEVYCIRYHMGAFTDKEEWNQYTKACSLYPNVLWTHTADMVASNIMGV